MTYLKRFTGLVGAVILIATLSATQPAGAVAGSTSSPAPWSAGRPAPVAVRSASTLGSFMVNYHSELCAQIVGVSTASAAPLEQRTCDYSGGNHSQLWNLQLTNDGAGYLLVNLHSGLCVEPQGASMTSGVALLQAACVISGANHGQAWNLIEAADDSGPLWVNYHSGLCAHVAAASTSNGARLDQQPCVLSGGDHAMVWNLLN